MTAGKPAETPVDNRRRADRFRFIDWTRGLGAFIMLQGHVFHSFARPDLRGSDLYVLSQFVGGMPPAIFLFLTGITMGFLLDKLERREPDTSSGWVRVLHALRRARYLFLLAFAFRLQLWLFGLPSSPWTDLLKVDILNAMGTALAVSAFAAPLSLRGRMQAGLFGGALVASLGPFVSMAAPFLHPLVRAYVAPDPNSFGFFPWGAFVLFGLGAGSVLRMAPRDQLGRVLQWAAVVGFALILGGQFFSNIPYSIYPKSDFWIDGPGLVFIKLGVMMLMLAAAYLWTEFGAGEGWSPLRQLGSTSLLVYWVHIELVYGRWFWFWKENLGIPACLVGSVVLIAAMLWLSWARTDGFLGRWIAVGGRRWRDRAALAAPGKSTVTASEL